MYFLSILFNIITKIRNTLYDFGVLKIFRIKEVEIICIGNITVGGTGKTPAVQYFAKQYLKDGKKVAIVSRGYKGKRKEKLLIVRDEENIYSKASECGDEAFLHALALDIPVIVGANRYEACKLAYNKFKVDLIILDDGFQHRKLFRNKNIILIDSTNPFGNKYLLPKGRLRENLNGLKRADEFIITKCDLMPKKDVELIEKELKIYNKKIQKAVHGPTSLYNKYKFLDLDEIKDKKILLFSALANPKQFEQTIKNLGAKEIKTLNFPDHYYYNDKDFAFIDKEAIEFQADLIISTEKDLVKFEHSYQRKNLYTLKIEFRILES